MTPKKFKPIKLDPAIKAKWVAALRSGTYVQGKTRLRFNDEYCCLGVLCELAVGEGVAVRGEWFDSGSADHPFIEYWYGATADGERGEQATAYPPSEVQGWSHVDPVGEDGAPYMVMATFQPTSQEKIHLFELDENGYATEPQSLMALNDVRNFNFDQIADLIEAQL